ncbi:unnamed protein product [Amoebophrya sp. A120]|nr:unnamed protein product [Amoebophrya sp. A120]|eukprot:GSA120T00007969001.1
MFLFPRIIPTRTVFPFRFRGVPKLKFKHPVHNVCRNSTLNFQPMSTKDNFELASFRFLTLLFHCLYQRCRCNENSFLLLEYFCREHGHHVLIFASEFASHTIPAFVIIFRGAIIFSPLFLRTLT